MTDKVHTQADIILSIVGFLTGIAGTMASIEQIFRIIFLFLSIVSCLLIILINWKKGMDKLIKFFKK